MIKAKIGSGISLPLVSFHPPSPSIRTRYLLPPPFPFPDLIIQAVDLSQSLAWKSGRLADTDATPRGLLTRSVSVCAQCGIGTRSNVFYALLPFLTAFADFCSLSASLLTTPLEAGFIHGSQIFWGLHCPYTCLIS